MNHSDHPDCNLTIGPPENAVERGLKCDSLRAQAGVMEPGFPFIQSYWKPTPEELALLNANGYVTLFVFSNQMPPVYIGVTS
jgi:hypothetical protein